MAIDFNEEWKRLNKYQMEAVRDESAACVVNANVGSGKTTVLIEKILYLHFEKQVPLKEMIVLTFTNKAAEEIIDRLLKKEPSLSREQVQGFGTFHSVALYLLKNRLQLKEFGRGRKETADNTGRSVGHAVWNRDFTVIDPDEEADLAIEIIAEQKLNVKYKNRLKKRLEQEYNGYLQGREYSRYRDDLFLLYPLLEEEKRRQNKMSFSDLLRVSTALLNKELQHPKWIIVDEVQDSDALQMDFLTALAGEETKLFAVGDPNQVIYSWRGTTQNTFYVLKQRFGARELSLPINYRSNASILEAANRFLQFGDKIQGSRDAGSRIVVKNHYDPFLEAEYLAERIRGLHEEGTAYNEIAIFYRLQKQSEVLEKVFAKYQIPYEVSVRKTIKDIPVLDWFVKVLRFSCNHADAQIGVQVLIDVQYGEKCTKKRAKDIILNHEAGTSLLYQRMLDFAGQEVWQQVEIPEPEVVFAYFGLRDALHPTSADFGEDEKLVLGFLSRLCAYCRSEGYSFVKGTREFVNSSALYGVDFFENSGEGEPDAVKLMTLHASKGLEFDTVFLIGCNQGLIPLHSQDFDQEEEESRLFFVGLTRARNRLELSYYTNPGDARVSGECSRYLRRIPVELLEWEEVRGDEERRRNLQELRKEVLEQRRGNVAGNEIVKRARHPKYGTGILVAEDEMMVEVEFEGYGKKQFLKAFGEVEIE